MDLNIKRLFDSLPKELFDLKIIHHGATVNTIFCAGYFENRIINLSNEITLLQVNDSYGSSNSKINKIKFSNPNQIIDIVVPVYEKWLSKPRGILKYVKDNYSSLPNYILYTDATDVAILNDIENPKEILDFYKCDILFNCEPNYMHTGFGEPSHSYYNPLYEKEQHVYELLNKEKYGVNHTRSLNAGVFLGKKDYVLEFLEESIKYMEDDFNKGFPYGCLDDQCMFRWMQNKYFDKISVDVYNKWFLFAYPKCLEVNEDDWEHFTFFKRKNEHLYIK